MIDTIQDFIQNLDSTKLSFNLMIFLFLVNIILFFRTKKQEKKFNEYFNERIENIENKSLKRVQELEQENQLLKKKLNEILSWVD